MKRTSFFFLYYCIFPILPIIWFNINDILYRTTHYPMKSKQFAKYIICIYFLILIIPHYPMKVKSKKIEKHCLNTFVFYIDNIIYYLMNSIFFKVYFIFIFHSTTNCLMKSKHLKIYIECFILLKRKWNELQ